MKTAIIGSGTAGAAAAVFLKRAGHHVHVFEQAPTPRAVGAGFMLQPTGMDVLRELGIEKEIISHASKIAHLHVFEKDGRALMKLRYAELGPNLFGAGLHRPVVMDALLGLMTKEAIPISWNTRIETAQKLPDGWEVADQKFDLLVIADGTRSALRRALLGPGHDKGYPWGAHWFIGKNNGIFPENTLHQIVHGTRQLAGFLPTGTSPESNQTLLSLFWSIRLDQDAETRRQPLDQWKSTILSLCPQSADLLSQITTWDQILTARYGDVRMKNWHGDRLVFLGDAAHAMSPQLGQGVNLALADASCLAACLNELPLAKALPEYSRRRRPILRYYQLATRSLTPVFQSDLQFISPARHLGFRLSQHLPPLRKLMTKSMAGMMRLG